MAGRTEELTGLVRPKIDDRALQRETRKLERRMGSAVENLVPFGGTLRRGIGRLTGRSTPSGAGVNTGRGGGGTIGGQSVQVAQLKKLDDIHDELQQMSGGGGGAGGVLAGFGLGKLLGGGAAAGGLGISSGALLAGGGFASLLAFASIFGDEGLREQDRQTGPPGPQPPGPPTDMFGPAMTTEDGTVVDLRRLGGDPAGGTGPSHTIPDRSPLRGGGGDGAQNEFINLLEGLGATGGDIIFDISTDVQTELGELDRRLDQIKRDILDQVHQELSGNEATSTGTPGGGGARMF